MVLKQINLKNGVEFPLNKLVSVTGVFGSGKSSLINHTLIPAIQNKLLGTKLPERVKYKTHWRRKYR